MLRGKSEAHVVAVVGSAGKTTTKDILAALCSPHAPTIAAEMSLNNEIGLPLTVCRLEPETAILVTEMGMRGLGQIAALCAIARPEIAVVPHIGPEHLELAGPSSGSRRPTRRQLRPFRPAARLLYLRTAQSSNRTSSATTSRLDGSIRATSSATRRRRVSQSMVTSSSSSSRSPSGITR
jgi:UDP-N-acetylmuramyl pentapeptide synthase